MLVTFYTLAYEYMTLILLMGFVTLSFVVISIRISMTLILTITHKSKKIINIYDIKNPYVISKKKKIHMLSSVHVVTCS